MLYLSLFGSQEAKEINLENFADGTYILMITDENNTLIAIEKVHKLTH